MLHVIIYRRVRTRALRVRFALQYYEPSPLDLHYWQKVPVLVYGAEIFQSMFYDSLHTYDSLHNTAKVKNFAVFLNCRIVGLAQTEWLLNTEGFFLFCFFFLLLLLFSLDS